mmetsp:Transcript_9018/g.12833  ORF Transcript_9018/g.12833 Transcript_9018/m.12833 type:complete len:116 (-) Transcript_9018:454-801(-)
MMNMHLMQLSRSGPVIVTARSEVADIIAAAAVASALVPSFGDNLTADTPDDSTMCLTFVPPLPIIIPQQGTGTTSRTTNAKVGGPPDGFTIIPGSSVDPGIPSAILLSGASASPC